MEVPNDILDFLRTVSELKKIPRTGWIGRVPNPENISGHIFRTALLAMLFSPNAINRDKCVRMALIHDIAESVIGDLTPDQAKTVDKHNLEMDGMKSLCSHLPKEKRDEIVSLFSEFEDKSTAEAQFVNQLDKLEMVLQAREYELDNPPLNLEPFFSSTEGIVTNPAIAPLDSAVRASRPHTSSEGNL